MYDIHVILSNSPGSLGAMGMALGNNGRRWRIHHA